MKRLQISYTNQKGQFVIPKEYRDALDINEDVALLSKMMGKKLVITPINTVTLDNQADKPYSEVLKSTRGAWAGSYDKTEEQQREKIELVAAKERKRKW